MPRWSLQMKFFPAVTLLPTEYIRLLHPLGGVIQGLCEPLSERGECQVVHVLRRGLQERQQLPISQHPGCSHQAPDPGSPGQRIICAVTGKIQQSKLLDVAHFCRVSWAASHNTPEQGHGAVAALLVSGSCCLPALVWGVYQYKVLTALTTGGVVCFRKRVPIQVSSFSM